VALHAGTAAGLTIALRHELAALPPRAAALLGVASFPPAVAGYLLERPVERYLGGPAVTAVGLICGGLAMARADARNPHRRRGEDARAADALSLGFAQALALIPGVSRSGAALAAARWRGFGRRDAHRLSRHAGLPVLAGASLLKTVRLLQRPVDQETGARLAAGAAAAFVSTLAAARVIGPAEGSLWPYAAYRIALAAVILRRLRDTSGRCSTMRA
jgi:undecaprenyl-diphosphatase